MAISPPLNWLAMSLKEHQVGKVETGVRVAKQHGNGSAGDTSSILS
jgi:hypothetical protein